MMQRSHGRRLFSIVSEINDKGVGRTREFPIFHPYIQWCRFLGQEVREKRRGFGRVAARVSPLRTCDFHAQNSNFYP